MPGTEFSSQPLLELRPSSIQGLGAFAFHPIAKGTRVIEYLGERITPEEADERYDDDAMERPHTFLFTVDKKTVIDAARQGNEARFINHSCDPNCQAVVEDGRVFIEAIRDIPPGVEVTYDYHLERPGRYRAEWKERYACRCGASSCRGTLLPPRRRRVRKTSRGANKRAKK
jgi:SET domain-containing protein